MTHNVADDAGRAAALVLAQALPLTDAEVERFAAEFAQDIGARFAAYVAEFPAPDPDASA